MSDPINREDAINAIYHHFPQMTMRECADVLHEVPPAEVTLCHLGSPCEYQNADIEMPIVVCGDCIHWISHDRRCGYWNHGVKPLDWCSRAERRTNG